MNDEFKMLNAEKCNSALVIQHSALKEPEIRFEGFSGEWEDCSIGNITVFHKQGFYTTENYAPSKKYYLLRGTDLNNNKLVLNGTPKINATEKDYKDFKVEIGDVLLVRSGNVGTYGIVYENIEGIFGSYLINFRFDKTMVINEFFGCFYQSQRFFKQLRQIIQQSANTNINAENIKSIDICLTNLPEQTQIGNFFQKLDSLINQHQQKHDKLCNIKKAMLEKMFPKQGENIPEIRFKGFSGDWEIRKTSELCSISTGKNNTQDKVPEGKYPFYVRSAIIERSNNYLFDEKAVLTVGDGVGTGKVYHYVNGKYDLHQRVYTPILL